jgi:hypothetical protein
MPSSIETIKNTGEKLRTARYHFLQNRQAGKTLRQIEAEKGKTATAGIKKARSYAMDVLGWSGYAPWLCVYTAVAGEFKEGWLPDNYYGAVVVPHIQGAYGDTSHLKALHPKLFNTKAFPDIAYRVNGRFYSGAHQLLTPKDLKSLLFNEAEKVVFKADHSFQGRGISFLAKDRFHDLLPGLPGNGVFQACIVQHPFFSAFAEKSVASLRLTTVSTETGSAELCAAYLRLGRKADTHVQSASHIRVAVALQSGDLSPFGYLPSWGAIQTHPDSAEPFGGKVIPNFDACVQTVTALHAQMPFVQCIGWDLIVDNKGEVKIMEWNGAGNDIKFSEATQGPCFKGLGWESLWRKK